MLGGYFIWNYMLLFAYMKLEELQQKRDELQARFDEQAKIKLEAEQEQLRLQGEHRALTSLIDELVSKVKEESE